MVKIFKKITLSIFLFSSFASAQNITLNENNPEKYQQFKLDYEEMVDIANPDRLAWRIFYEKPSEGENAAWFDAVKQGNLASVQKMVEEGQNIEVKDEASLGQTALGWAAFIGYEDMVDYLLSQNADLWATDRGDVSHALKSAALGKNVNIFKKLYELLKDDVDINDQEHDAQGETMLIVAASNDRYDIVSYLLELGADPNRITTEQNINHPGYDQDALTFACERGNDRIVKLLIENGAINHRTGTASCN